MRPAPIRLLCAERLAQEVGSARVVLDVGSGGRRLAPHVITVDIVKRPNVDVLADLCGKLPFPNGTFDLVVCTSVLEHVVDVTNAVGELRRILRPGGRLWLEIPFLYHFHVSGAGDVHDFHRWTLEGAKRLFPDMHLVDWGHNVGPGSALRLTASEVLAMPFYHPRHEGLYYLMRWGLSWALYPLSWLDRLCIGKDVAARATGGFWLLWQKP